MFVLVVFVIVVGFQENEPKRFWVCLVGANPETGGDLSTVINDDQWEYYQKKYEGSYKGKCREKDDGK